MKQKIRGLVGLVLIFLWSLSGLSGLVLHFAPEGRWSGREALLWGLPKHAWTEFHTVVSFLALGITLVHIVLDWKIFVTLIRCLAAGSAKQNRECRRSLASQS